MISYDAAVRVISKLKIFSQTDSCLSRWDMNEEQRTILRALCQHKRIITLKARQIGSTSIHAAYVALVAVAHPHTPIAVLNYSFAESKSILRRIKSFLSQMGVALATENATELILRNGSSITAITAVSAIDGESKAGRGRSYRLIFSSETAYYRDSTAVFASISAALTRDGQILMESTATPGDGIFRRTWSEDTGYTKLFFGLEAHDSYRAPADSISDETWNELQLRYSFTDRRAAAWWWDKLQCDLGGDERRALREYPVSADHSWTAAEGRWIPDDPVVRPYSSDAAHRQLHIYRPKVSNHFYVASIDTALGAGGDDAVAVVYDCTAGEIVASFCHNETPIDEVIRLASDLQTRYGITTWYVENNGIGQASVLLGRRAGLPIVEINTNIHNRSIGMLWVRRRVAAGMAADEALLANCRSCSVYATPAGDRYSGKKDFLLALAMIGQHEPAWREAAARPPPKVYAPGDFRADEFLNRAIKANRSRR